MKIFKKHLYLRFLMIMGITLLVANLLYHFMGFYYFMNDDITMQQLSSGYYTGLPDGHLAKFINYIYGFVIVVFFSICPSIDWYGGVLLGLIFICYGLIIARVLRVTVSCEYKIVLRVNCIIGMVALFLESTILFQFTVVSGILAATVLFLLVTAKKDGSPWFYVLIWALYLISTMFRVKMIFMVAPLFGIIAIYKIYEWYCNNFPIKELFKRNFISADDKRRILTYILITLAGMVEYYVATEPPVRCGESHHSGQTEPPYY